jgi:Protein of unknown function (DUF2917)
MRIDLNARTAINLEKDEFIELPRSPGHAVVCTRGALWVTEINLPHDHALREGDRYVSKGAGPVAVQAFESSAFRVVECDRTACWLPRIAHRIIGIVRGVRPLGLAGRA